MTLMAADATGKWSGTIVRLDSDSDGEAKPAYMVLKQDGAKLTGTAGPSASEQMEILDGKAEEGRLTFRLEENGMMFDLKQDGDEITGEITREHDGQKQKAKLALKRQN
jgi:hypothetical protein